MLVFKFNNLLYNKLLYNKLLNLINMKKLLGIPIIIILVGILYFIFFNKYSCIPDCTEKVCGDDGCGGSCATGCLDKTDTCIEGKCFRCQPQCDGKECGPDGCEGKCGLGCSGLDKCNESGECVCQSICDGKECGPDGCGKFCGKDPNGLCSDNHVCTNGSCMDCIEDGGNCNKTTDCCADNLICTDGKCIKCNVGFSGNHCQFSDKVTCNGNGVAQDDGSCKCAIGYVDVQNNGLCSALGTDTCSGFYCDNWLGSTQCVNQLCSIPFPRTIEPITNIHMSLTDISVTENCPIKTPCQAD